jgi:hypothetical protein
MSRFLPHPQNFTAALSVGIFAGFLFKNKAFGYIIPISAMIASDLFIGMHSTIWAVYTSILIAGFIGANLKKSNPGNIALSSFISAVIFFAITNFAVWLNGIMYPMNIAGLTSCYISAIPFFGYILLSTVVYSFIIFEIYNLFEKYIFSKGISNQLN